ncbi:MAG: thiolase family protein [Flavobacteriales bacterium]|nr:thiolase family protein [Flavobacteriales bacterium]
MSKEVVIVSAQRTPMGSFLGSLSKVPATRLGSIAIAAAIKEAGISADQVGEVFMGNVLQAGLGQSPARQAAMEAGVPDTAPCTTVNKVCASGMKAIAFGVQAIALGEQDVVVAGGMENMSQVPFYHQGRSGQKLGDISLKDGLLLDGLTDVYNNQHMGVCAEFCASEKGFSREEQDAFAIESYKRSAAAWDAGRFDDEVCPVEIPQRRGDAVIVSKDEEYSNVNYEKIPKLRTVFKKDGTVTAANASAINDGASAVVLMSAEKAADLGVTPLARVRSAADAAHDPLWFTIAPSKALPLALDRAGLSKDDVDLWELNEAFSVVGLANNALLELDASKVNVNGGAVALGHPLGSSGSRIIVTLIHALKQRDLRIGAAGICNGGGGASAMVIERL